MRKLWLVIVVGVAPLVAVGCGTIASLVGDSPFQGQVCNRAPLEFAFPPYGIPEEFPTPIPMTLAWEPQLSEEQAKGYYFDNARDILPVADDEIWFLLNFGQLLRYTPSTGELTEYAYKGKPFPVSEIFLDVENELWVNSSGGSRITLYRYNPKTNQFALVYDKAYSMRDGQHSTQIPEGAKTFLLELNGNLIRVYPDNEDFDVLVGLNEGYWIHDFAIAPDGVIWLNARDFGGKSKEAYSDQFVILRYYPKSGYLDEYDRLAKSRPGAVTLFFDHLGRLWFNDEGWIELLEPGGLKWFQVIRSPIFITTLPELEGGYFWVAAFPVHETKDRYMWFNSRAGVAVLDLESNQWCLLTRFSSPVAEDADHNIWIAGNDQIYKLRVEP